VLARSHDIVCVSDEVDPAYLAYLAGLGPGPTPENVVAASRFGGPPSGRTLWVRLEHSSDAPRALGTVLRRSGPTRIHPFIASRGPFALAAALEVAAEVEVRVAAGAPGLVAYADQKHHIRRKAIELGVPVAEGEVVELPVAGGRRRRDYDVVRGAVARRRQLPAISAVVLAGSITLSVVALLAGAGLEAVAAVSFLVQVVYAGAVLRLNLREGGVAGEGHFLIQLLLPLLWCTAAAVAAGHLASGATPLRMALALPIYLVLMVPAVPGIVREWRRVRGPAPRRLTGRADAR